jgi:hypothetical protein
MSIVTISYELSEKGRKAAILAGQSANPRPPR